MSSYCEEDQFKGYPVLKIFTGKEYNGEKECIILGVRKAGAVCEQIDVIRRFVDHWEHPKGR